MHSWALVPSLARIVAVSPTPLQYALRLRRSATRLMRFCIVRFCIVGFPRGSKPLLPHRSRWENKVGLGESLAVATVAMMGRGGGGA